MLVIAGCGAVGTDGTDTTGSAATTTGSGEDAGEQTDDGARPADPESDRLGWEDGRWYDEQLDIDRSDGLNESELEAVVSRAMARVEKVRKLEFEERPPVEIISREAYRERLGSRNTSTAMRLHQNTKWEATFMVNESTNAIAVRQANSASGVQGFYDPRKDEIVVVSPSETPELDEITLAQELYHALQDQRWNITSYDQSTLELHNAKDGIIEGDGNYVDSLYKERCETEWDCLEPQRGGQGGGATDINVGLYQVRLQPYSDGVAFVQERRQQGGWEAVNAVYEQPPKSTEQTIHPDLYGEDAPTDLTIADRSSDGWHALDVAGPTDHASFGEAGMFVMLWYASFEETQATGTAQDVVIPYRAHFNLAGQGLNETDPYNYAHPATAGWDGDRLLPYVNGSSASTGETGYVWKSEWDSEEDARQFADAYRELLRYHGASAVDGRANTFRIAEDEEFADAFSVRRQGTTVTIVNAPTVDALSDVHAPGSDSAATTNSTAA